MLHALLETCRLVIPTILKLQQSTLQSFSVCEYIPRKKEFSTALIKNVMLY